MLLQQRSLQQPRIQHSVLCAVFQTRLCAYCRSAVLGDRNDLDGTCQMYVQVGFFFSVAAADAVLSAAYLYLFVQPLRETIRLNANHRRGLMVGGEATAPIVKTSSARVAPENAYVVEGGPTSPSAAASAALNTSLALEAVMRRNTYAVATAISSCCTHFSFTITAMAIDEPHMRKLTMPVALIVSTHSSMQFRTRSDRCSSSGSVATRLTSILFSFVTLACVTCAQDCTVMLAALCFVLHTRAGVSSSSSTAPAVQVVSLRTKHSSTSDAPQTKLAFMTSASDRAASPVPTTKWGSLISTATPATSQPDQRRDEPDQSPV